MVLNGLPATVTSPTYPSVFRMCAMLSFILECGISTAGNSARCALRIRVNMSEIGSIIKLPACLRHTGNQSVQRGFAERQTRTTELAPITAAASAERTAIDQTRWAGVTRQFRQTGVIAFRFQFSAERGVFFHCLLLALIALFPCFLRHKIILLRLLPQLSARLPSRRPTGDPS